MSVKAACVSLAQRDKRHSVGHQAGPCTVVLHWCFDIAEHWWALITASCPAAGARRRPRSDLVQWTQLPHLADVSPASEASLRGDAIFPDPAVGKSELSRAVTGLRGSGSVSASKARADRLINRADDARLAFVYGSGI